MRFAICVVGALILSSACGADRTLNVDDSRKTIELHVGNTVEVVLEENPSTGHSWAVVNFDSEILVQHGDGEYRGPLMSRPGAPGTVRFLFEAVGIGTSTLRLELDRPGPSGQPPAATFEVTVNVDGRPR
jgi:predicted secreted protein